MVTMTQLWLPILIAAIAVFVVSSILHVLLRFWHGTDMRGFDNETEIAAAMRKGNPAPGMYSIPFACMGDRNKPDMHEKFSQGPVGIVVLRRTGTINMGVSLSQWFLFCLLVAYFCGYLGVATLLAGTPGSQVFRVLGTAGIMVFAIGVIPTGIWSGHPWKIVMKAIIDGIIYGFIIGAVFAWLWPK